MNEGEVRNEGKVRNKEDKPARSNEQLARLNVEMIFRKSFMDSLKEYVQNCSLAGARQVCDPNLGKFARIFWMMVFCTALGTVCYFLQYIWSDTLNKPLIVSMESSTYPIASIDFPAVAICNINRISKKALIQYAKEEFPFETKNKKKLEIIMKSLVNWGRLINYSYNESLRTNPIILQMVEKYRYDNQRVTEIMKMLAPKCEDMFVRCAWEGRVKDCKTLFSMHRIANRGHCCAFNYWSNLKTEIKRQREPGSAYGLNIALNPLLDDYAYPLSAMAGFDVLLLDPSHFADPSAGRVTHRICVPGAIVSMELKSTKQIASKEVRKYAIRTRKCLFQDENNKSYLDSYSYSSCLVFCRVMTIFSLCKCTPYFFAVKDMQKGPICTLENLRCLNKYREKLFYLYPFNAQTTKGLEVELQNSINCPDCLPDCELTQYVTKSYEIFKTTYKNKDANIRFLTGINITNGTFLSIYHPLPDATLDRLDVVSYWYEVLSNIGGFSGIIIGFSIMSVVEIIYFLTVRFIRNFYLNYNKYHY